MNEPRVGVGCIVVRQGKVLMLQRAGAHGAGTWSIPGGHLEWGEDPETTAVRETLEETGVQVAMPSRVGYTNDVMPDEGKHYITLFYKAWYRAGRPTVVEPEKCPRVEWVEPERFVGLDLFAPLERYVDEYGLSAIFPSALPQPLPEPGCLFCAHIDSTQHRIIAENAYAYARWDNHPAAPGHLQVVPKRHVVSFFELEGPEIEAVYRLLEVAKAFAGKLHQPDGYTLGVNEGEAAGRTVHHLHIHLIPRRWGDTPDPRGGVRNILANGMEAYPAEASTQPE